MIKCFPCLRCGLLGFLLALAALPVQAQTRVPMTFGDLEITLQSTPQGSGWHGYCEYAFRVRNQSGERPHTVTLSIPFDRDYHRGDTIRDLRRTVQVGANETVRLGLLQPDYPPIGGSNVAVFIDGQRQQFEIQMRPHESNFAYRSRRGRFYYSTSATGGRNAPLLLIGSGVGSLPIQRGGIPAPLPGGAGAPAGGGAPMPPPGMSRSSTVPSKRPPAPAPKFDVDIPPPPFEPGLPPNSFQPVNPEPVENWSNNWLAYSRYDGVLVTADELKTMPAGVRSALWQYVETGGFLFIIGPTELNGLSAVTEKKTDASWTRVHAGFGECLISPNDDYKKWDAEHFQELSQKWNALVASWSMGQRGTTEANTEFPVVEDLGVPVKGLFVLMFLFTLAIGPVNLLMLSRLKRRIWLLWTTPVISLATCLTVFGYMLFSEGWEGRLRTETLTLLDETTHRATTIGWTGVYSPLTPSEGLHFSSDTEVIPQRFFDDFRGGARSCTINWSQDQHFASGWVEARVPAHFKVRKSEIRRERVTLHREGEGSWSMVNGLGTPIHRFWFADDKGQIHAAENIAAGARAPLKLTEKETQAVTTSWSLSTGGWMSQAKELTVNPGHYLRPGNYLAEVDDSPFLEDALRNAKKRTAHALIVGFRQQEGKNE